jgi:hypothetical protein
VDLFNIDLVSTQITLLRYERDRLRALQHNNTEFASGDDRTTSEIKSPQFFLSPSLHNW